MELTWALLLLFCLFVYRVNREQRWKLSLCENRSRMRLKLVPNPHFDPHIQASRLRDNAGELSHVVQSYLNRH